MVMDSLKMLIYIASRIGMMILLCVFGAFIGVILFPAVCTLMPGSWHTVKTFFTDTDNMSIIAFAVTTIIMVRLFYNDGKLHSAYEEWSSVMISTVLLFMLFIYFIPAIFYESFNAEGKGKVFYLVLYYESEWLRHIADMPYTVSVLIGMGMTLFCCFASYIIAFRIYVRRHPVILKQMAEKAAPSSDEDEDENDESGEEENMS